MISASPSPPLAAPAASAVYGNFATRSTPQATDSYQFGVVGDILLLGVANQPDATGGVLGTNAAGDFGILGYKSRGGTFYSGYFGNVGGVVTGTGRTSNTANGNIGLGVNARIISIGVTWGYNDKNLLTSAGADYFVDDANELSVLMKKLFIQK